MMIVNSKTTPSYQTLPNPHPFSTGFSSRKQYDSIKELQNEEQLSIIQWIKENFYEQYTHCRNVHKIQDLFNGIALAEIVSSFLSDQGQKEDFLNEIELVKKIQTKNDLKVAAQNINSVIQVVKEMFALVYGNSESLVRKNKNNVNLVKLVQISMKSLESYNGQNLVNSKSKMKNFIMQIIMILPEISIALKQPNITKPQKLQKQNLKPIRIETNTKNSKSSSLNQYRTQPKNSTHNYENQYQSGNQNYNIEQLSSIIGYSTAQNNQKIYFSNIHLNPVKQSDQNMERKTFKTVQQYKCLNEQEIENDNIYLNQVPHEMKHDEKQFQNKVQRLLSWIQSSYNINISQLMQPHFLLGELVNKILAPNRLKENEKPIKPTHYQLGSYSVYKKALDLLTSIQRLNKSNLIALMKQVQAGKVNETTYWSLIQDIHLMVRNKVSQPMTSRRRQSKPKSVKKTTQQSQKITTQYDQNINIDNIRNQSVTELLKQKQDSTKRTNILKDHPLFAQQVIRQTQLWLQNEMGMGHPLNKSKPNAKTNLFENPLLNGTLFAKIIQRLKIGSAKGVLTPQDKKQLKNNMDIVKTEFLNRGYQSIRKIDIYKSSYNFFIGLLSQIRQIHASKQSNIKKLIIDDKQRRQIEQAQTQIPISQRQELEKWMMQDYNEEVHQVNGMKQISLRQMKVVIESIVKVNFLKETTQKIRLLNYIKLLEFFRSIGFSHYSVVRVEEVVSENVATAKKTQNLRWMILRDLRIIKGN